MSLSPSQSTVASSEPVRLSPNQRSCVLAIVGVGAVVATLGATQDIKRALLAERSGMLLVVYGLMVLIGSSSGAGWLRKKVSHFTSQGVSGTATGYYSLAALAVFTHAELKDLLDLLVSFQLDSFRIRDVLVPHLIGFSVDSMMNAIWSAMWPLLIYTRSGLMPTAIFAALAWTVFWVGGRFFPHHMFVAGSDDEDDRREEDGSASPPTPLITTERS